MKTHRTVSSAVYTVFTLSSLSFASNPGVLEHFSDLWSLLFVDFPTFEMKIFDIFGKLFDKPGVLVFSVCLFLKHLLSIAEVKGELVVEHTEQYASHRPDIGRHREVGLLRHDLWTVVGLSAAERLRYVGCVSLLVPALAREAEVS